MHFLYNWQSHLCVKLGHQICGTVGKTLKSTSLSYFSKIQKRTRKTNEKIFHFCTAELKYMTVTCLLLSFNGKYHVWGPNLTYKRNSQLYTKWKTFTDFRYTDEKLNKYQDKEIIDEITSMWSLKLYSTFIKSQKANSKMWWP